MKESRVIKVIAEGRKVGTLVQANDNRIAFEYDSEWIENGFSINPFSLPLRKEIFFPRNYNPFEGLFGVFFDSLPDGWGRLLVDRMLRKQGISDANSLYRLALVGQSGMGLLEYVPSIELKKEVAGLDFDEIAISCKQLLQSAEYENIDTLFELGASSGGARPKILQKIQNEDWIVKFPSSYDKNEIGKMEFDYSICARKCGIKMMETKLIPSKYHEGYFATKRFDRKEGKKVHVISVSGLLETSHQTPNLDYNTLMQLTMKLTGDFSEVEKMYKLMCFNVFAHNRDDHSKNFSFLFDMKKKLWKLTPAYDLTYSKSIGGEHATTVNDNGKNPDISHILEVAKKAKMNLSKAETIAKKIYETVQTDLKEYLY
ncbi:MAG: type II toxin-antitoxin system HipA family toxin [Eubacteriales bacterium]